MFHANLAKADKVGEAWVEIHALFVRLFSLVGIILIHIASIEDHWPSKRELRMQSRRVNVSRKPR